MFVYCLVPNVPFTMDSPMPDVSLASYTVRPPTVYYSNSLSEYIFTARIRYFRLKSLIETCSYIIFRSRHVTGEPNPSSSPHTRLTSFLIMNI